MDYVIRELTWKEKIKGQELDDLMTYLFSIAEKTEEW